MTRIAGGVDDVSEKYISSKAATFPFPADEGRKARHLSPLVNEMYFSGCMVWTDEHNVHKKLKGKYKDGTVCHKREFYPQRGSSQMLWRVYGLS